MRAKTVAEQTAKVDRIASRVKKSKGSKRHEPCGRCGHVRSCHFGGAGSCMLPWEHPHIRCERWKR